MKRTLAVLAATVLVASLATPMMAADTSSTPSGSAATSASSTTTGSGAEATAPASESKPATATKHHHHRSKKHRTLHHAHTMDKGTGSTTPPAMN
jgi:hypothetical protein